jgi:hypothetical protein
VLQGAKPFPMALSIGLGLIVRFLVPIPAGVTAQSWSLLAIFVSTIAGKAALLRLRCWGSPLGDAGHL